MMAIAAPADFPDDYNRLIAGRYRLIALLGVGGMGVTYRAWDTQAGIPVVVKMPRPEVRSDGETMQRFAREIDAMLAVSHEAIVPITDHGEDDGCPFVVMPFLPGGSLADYRRRDNAGNAIRNPPGMLHCWLPGVAAALDHIHSRGMLHRDLKPGNIFLDGFLNPYLGDFGIAKVVDDSGGLRKEQTLTATNMAIGTPEYMAPELFNPKSKPDGRVDQYALAVTVYEMLSGEKPFKGDRAHIIVEHTVMPVPPLAEKMPGLPRSICMAVEKALAKKAADRFPTCSEFAAAVVADLPLLEAETGTVRLLCPSCKNILKLPEKAAGKTGKCPRCRAAVGVAADMLSLWLETEEWAGGVEGLGKWPLSASDCSADSGRTHNGNKARVPFSGTVTSKQYVAAYLIVLPERWDFNCPARWIEQNDKPTRLMRIDEVGILGSMSLIGIAIALWFFDISIASGIAAAVPCPLLYSFVVIPWINWRAFRKTQVSGYVFAGSIGDDCVVLNWCRDIWLPQKWLHNVCEIEIPSAATEHSVQSASEGRGALVRWDCFLGAILKDDMMVLVCPTEIALVVAAYGPQPTASSPSSLTSACRGLVFHKHWFKSDSQWREVLSMVEKKLGIRRLRR